MPPGQHCHVPNWEIKLPRDSQRIPSIGVFSAVYKMGGVKPAFAPGPAPALGDSSLCSSGLACFLFLPSWADPSVGTLTWKLHWASWAGGWWSNPSLKEVDGVSPSSARSSGKLCNDSDHQPALLGVFQAGPGQCGSVASAIGALSPPFSFCLCLVAGLLPAPQPSSSRS